MARYELILTEQEVNQLVQDGLAAQPGVAVTNVGVRLERGLIVASGRARLGFLAMNLEVDVTLAVEDGKAVPEIVAIRAGGRPLTGFLRAQVEGMIAPALQQWLQTDTNVTVEEVEIKEGQIRITGRFK